MALTQSASLGDDLPEVHVPDSHFLDRGVSAQRLEAACRVIGCNIVEFAERSGRSILQDSWPWDDTAFRDGPVLHQEGIGVVLSPHHLAKRITDGVLWVVAESAEPMDRKQFLDSRGRAFEVYVRDWIKEGADDLYWSGHVRSKDGRECEIDGALLQVPHLILFEACAAVPLYDARVPTSQSDYREFIRTRIVPKVLEVLRKCDVVRSSSSPVFNGLRASAFSRVLPVVVFLGDLPQHGTVYALYQQELQRAGVDCEEGLGGVTLLSVDEMEMLMSVRERVSPAHVLQARQVDTQWRFESMRNYLLKYHLSEVRAGYQKRNQDRWDDLAQKLTESMAAPA